MVRLCENRKRAGGKLSAPLHDGGRAARALSPQSQRGAPRDTMPPLWILLVLLPVLGGAERFNCRGRILGAYYADAKSGCKAFHVCVRVAGGGIRDFRFFCPPGTLFHQEAQTCTDWGDDDPLACPADIYDGQFDLYKIGSGFDTKKLSSPTHREEEPDFGLQRAETGDRRLSQNNAASDLRAAHSSDFFSGQRDRGRDDPAPQENVPIQPARSSSTRQSFRRIASTRAPSSTIQYTNPPPTPSSQSSNLPQYDPNSKRKLIRKRPVYTSTPVPTTTFVQSTQAPQSFSDQPQQNFNRKVAPQNRQTLPPVNIPPQFKEYKDEYVEVNRVTPKPNKYFQSKSPPPQFSQSSPSPNNYKDNGLVELYNIDAQSTPGLNTQADTRPFKVQNSFTVSETPREPDFVRTRPNVNANNNNNIQRNKPTPTNVDFNNVASHSPTTNTPAFKNFNSVSYEPEKNNFVSYSKQNYFRPTTTPSTTFYTTTTRPELPANLNTVAYNTNIGFNTPNANFAESDEDDGQYRPPQGEDDGQYRPELYERELLSGAHSLNIAASGNRLPEDQKSRSKTQPPPKQFAQTAAPRPFRPAQTPTSPSTQQTPERTYPTTTRPQTQPHTQRTFDYFQTYTTTSRPSDLPVDPFRYDTETRAPVSPALQTRPPPPPAPQTRPPAPPAPQTRPPAPPAPQTRPPAPPAPQTRPPAPPVLQTRPHAPPAPQTRPPVPSAPQTRPPASPAPQTRPPSPPSPPTLAPSPPRPSTRPPSFAKPSNNKEDTSYDYAYYDSDPGFSEYDHIEEFGRTKSKA
ncbi:unnamed protein product [Diatraea saccharalis]|uniref:Chitin-binding type-2 domain-containing protein n=1 Tax=Diatraea saccharalis TaxID=40085 RepID=A0A9N9QWY8_9NEOP|nr:unnamed protein product [Diatraea saccharalis]